MGPTVTFTTGQAKRILLYSAYDLPPHPPRPLTAGLVDPSTLAPLSRGVGGSHPMTYLPRPTHWLDQQTGEWRRFTNRLQPASPEDARGGFAFASSDSAFQARFGDAPAVASGGALLALMTGAARLTVTMPGATPRRLLAYGARVTYSGLYPGVDLRFTLDNERIKEDLILSQPPSGAILFHFDLKLQGVTAQRLGDGTISLVDHAGEPVFLMLRPFLLDGNTELPLGERVSGAVQLAIMEPAAGRLRLTLIPSPEWLHDPARTYPVVLDPTIDTLVFEPVVSLNPTATGD